MRPFLQGIAAAVRRDPVTAATAAAAVLASIYVAAWPFTRSHLPPIADFPFHAAATSILRHYFDPAYHFREQFVVEPLKAPYWTMHGLGALFALVMPVLTAAKLTAVILLLMLPAGLAVMFHGMKKSPLLGVLGLPFVWNTLTHWGFTNFMGALGLFAAAIGFALMVVDAPTRGRQIALGVTLFLVFATHIFRFPFALAAVVGTGIVMYPATRTFRPLLAPLAPSVGAMLLWMAVREKELSSEGMGPLKLHFERFREVRGFLFGGLNDPTELALADRTYWLVGAAIASCLLAGLLEGRWRGLDRRERFWTAGVVVIPLSCALVFLVLYLMLPMQIGIWWYVYPREILAALFVAMGLCPDLPRRRPELRLPALGAIAFGAVGQAALVAKAWAAFDPSTRDFEEIVRALPEAPKLGYMVWDRNNPRFREPVYMHLPALVQAEKGGWLSFHFVSWNAWPIRYRPPGPDVPPPTPLRFEWTPERFDLKSRGRFFDWFLVRKTSGPDGRFAREPDLELVQHVGAWWLYRRKVGDIAHPTSP